MRNGKRVRMEHMELRGLASRLHPRVGVIVPKHKHKSVERNRLKRRLRELIRQHVLQSIGDFEIVVRTAPAAYDASVEELSAELVRGFGLLIPEK